MGDVVNLNRFRKAKARDEKQRQAEANRVRFGRTTAEKKREAAEAERGTKDLDGKQLE
jgi:hypothetical protein